MWLMAYPAENVTQYGDYPYYHGLAQLIKQGRLPFTSYWVEYPPLFAYLYQGIYALTGDRYSTFATLLALVMLAFEAGNLVMVFRLAGWVHARQNAIKLTWVYALLFAPAFVMWHNHDAISTFFLLLAADEYLRERTNCSAVWAGMGAMVKYFPALLLPVVWRFKRSTRQAVTYTAILVAVCAVMLVPFLIASPTYTLASLRAQTVKTSWQTIWALVDGNLGTGILGPVEWHTDPDKITALQGNPSRIPSVIPLLIFGVLYLWLWMRPISKNPSGNSAAALTPLNNLQFLAFTAITFIVFFLWSKGWSPQWLIMLIPFVLIVLPLRRALLYILSLSFIGLAEWPVFLSRGMNQYLYLTIPLRTALLVLLLIELTRIMHAPIATDKGQT